MADYTRQAYKEDVVYQIYSFSFKDTTGNGVGDLNGITSKLHYLKDLGVDVIWMSPIYASPMKDKGYDISDYEKINPDVGTLSDFDNLVARAHELGLKVVMDLVVNHTSDQHAWFEDSRNGGDKRDWYIWRDARIDENGNRAEPNNWGAIFGGSCWEWDGRRQQYYLHVFDVSQPDLNWENPDVRNAVWKVMEFWLNRGSDGFRMDVINCISKEPGFPDVPITDPSQKFQRGVLYRFNGPHLKDYLAEMYERVIAPREPNIFTVGEMPGVSTPEQALVHTKGGRPLQMIFHFEHMGVDAAPGQTSFDTRDWRLPELKKILGGFMQYGQEHDGWDSLYLENHDQPRIVSRWADDKKFRAVAAKMLAMFHATGRGTLYIFQGQVIGMANAREWKLEELRDVEEINHYNAIKATRPEGANMDDVLEAIRRKGRDNARMPISWDASLNAGFSTGKPWIKVNDDYEQWNVESQLGKNGSVLEFWRRMVRIRKEEPAFVYGLFSMLDEESEDVYAYTRELSGRKFVVICSFAARDVQWRCPVELGDQILTNYDSASDGSSDLSLRPYECRLYKAKM